MLIFLDRYFFLGRLVLYYMVKVVKKVFILESRFCMEWRLLCLGEDDGEEKIKHEEQLCACYSSTLI